MAINTQIFFLLQPQEKDEVFPKFHLGTPCFLFLSLNEINCKCSTDGQIIFVTETFHKPRVVPKFRDPYFKTLFRSF